jgi:hypothetical protein
MSNTDASYNPEPPPQAAPTPRADFPWQRLLLSLGFGVLAWMVFWLTLVLAVVLWILVAVSREPHPEFKQFVGGCARYVSQCLAYIVMITDETPFPLGPLPRGGD